MGSMVVAATAHGTRRGGPVVPLLLVLLAAVTLGRAAAQPALEASTERPSERAEQIEEMTVVGQRPLRELRVEVQLARERVYDLFNALNANDEFDIRCRSVPRTGTRIPQRVCRPQFADAATADAGAGFLRTLFYECGAVAPLGNEDCVMRAAAPRAQEALVEVPAKDRLLAAEVQRLARENPDFRRAITEYQGIERQYEEARRGEGSEWRVSASILGTARSMAPSRRMPGPETIAAPELTGLVTPDVPRSGRAAGALREGWVKLRYSVQADGTTADVRAVDALPSGLDPLSAVAAVQDWTFQPASAEGVPIDWHNNIAVIVFGWEPPVLGGSLDFADAYEDVAQLISAARYAEAKQRNERMQREHATTLDEIELAQMQLAAIEHALGDPHAALAAIRRATQREASRLADEELKLALEHRFGLELELGLVQEALQTYARRAALERVRSGDPIARQAAALRRALEAPEASLAARGRIDANGQWTHPLTLSTFAVGDVDGHNDSLDVECHRNKSALPFDADAEFTIPPAWGYCVLRVHGQPGTTFTLYEFGEPLG